MEAQILFLIVSQEHMLKPGINIRGTPCKGEFQVINQTPKILLTLIQNGKWGASRQLCKNENLLVEE